MAAGSHLFYSTLMLTAVNLLLRFVSTSFQVYLSGLIGAEGIGLLQLVLSVSGLAMTAGIAGIRTTAMYLTAEELGRNRSGNARRLVSGCIIYGLTAGGAVSILLFLAAPFLAESWIGNAAALPALRTFAAFLPVICLSGVMTGFFTAANRIGTLAAVEVAEQVFVMLVTILSLRLFGRGSSAGACQAVVFGSGCGSVLTLLTLYALYRGQRDTTPSSIPIARRICSCALPLALADDLKAGISALETLLVPKRLALYPGVSNPLASFGIISGMVFPVMMFPAAILFSLSEVLIPELARCAAVGSKKRIRYLLTRNLRVALLYGMVCGGMLFLLAEPLCAKLYPGVEVSRYLRWFSILVPMLYCDLVVDGMTKGLGQQKYCVRYNILSNVLDVALLFVLLPRYGISGYFFSFLVTHLLNFILSLRRLCITGEIRIRFWFPAMALAAVLLAVCGATWFTGVWRQVMGFLGLFFCLSYFFGVIRETDLRWAAELLKNAKNPQVT